MDLPPPQVPSADDPEADALPEPAPAGATRRPSGLALGAIAAVAGIGAGLLIGALAFGGDDEAATPQGGAADVAAGCLLLSALPDEIPERLGDDEDWSFDGPYIWRVQGVAAAFQSAGKAERQYRRLGEAGDTVTRAFQTFRVDEANDALGTLQDWCTEHDLGGG